MGVSATAYDGFDMIYIACKIKGVIISEFLVFKLMPTLWRHHASISSNQKLSFQIRLLRDFKTHFMTVMDESRSFSENLF